MRRALISTAPGGVGIALGDSIFPLDSSYAAMRDDFIHSILTSGQIGELGWALSNPSVLALNHQDVSDALPSMGWLGIMSGGTASSAAALTLQSPTTNAQGIWPLLDYPGWKAVYVFKFQRDWQVTATEVAFTPSHIAFYCGLGSYIGGFATGTPRPPVFVGVRFDTDTTAPSIGDATFKFEAVFNRTTSSARNNTQGQVIDTGMVPAEHVAYRLEMLCTARGVVQFTLSGGGTSFTGSLNITAPNQWTAGGQAGSVSVNNGLTQFAPTGVTANNWYAVGSILAVTSLAGAGVMLGGPMYSGGSSTTLYATVFGAGTAGAETIQVGGYPGLIPLIAFGNSNVATPVTQGMAIDLFALVWDTSLAANPLTLDSTRARYINVFGT